MTLTQFLAEFPSAISTTDKYTYIQEAFLTIVKKVRLDPSIHPLRFSGHIKLDEFNNMATVVTSSSEIAFKEYNGIIVTDYLEADQDFGAIDTALIGNIEDTDYGYTDFDEVNEFHNTVPQIYQIGSSMVCTNVDDCFFLLSAYAYPYLCYTANDIYTDQHVYNVSDMNDTHGADNLTVDPMLGTLTYMSAMSKYYEDNGDINRSVTIHDLTMKLINLFNTWKKTIGNDNLDFIGQIDASVGLS